MRNRRLRHDAVAEIENQRAVAVGRQDVVDGGIECRAGVEALSGCPGGHDPPGTNWAL